MVTTVEWMRPRGDRAIGGILRGARHGHGYAIGHYIQRGEDIPAIPLGEDEDPSGKDKAFGLLGSVLLLLAIGVVVVGSR